MRNLTARVTNPDLALTRAEGDAVLDGDSLRFAFPHLGLSATAASVSGAVRWSGGRTRLEASVNASRFAFRDVRSLVPLRLPADGGGSISLRLLVPGDGATEVDVAEAVIHTGRSAFTGRGRLTLGAHGGASLRGLDAVLEPLDLALLSLYADTVPVRGLVRGHVAADGALKDLALHPSALGAR